MDKKGSCHTVGGFTLFTTDTRDASIFKDSKDPYRMGDFAWG